MLRGEIDKSLEFLLKAQKVREELDFKGPSAVITDIATIYYLKGDLEKAKKMIIEEIKVCEQFEDKPALVYNFPIYSSILYQQGKIKEALKVRENLLKLLKEMGNKVKIGRTLGDIIDLCVDLNQYELAKQHLIQFKTIVDEIDNKLLLRAYHFSEAMVLKISQQQRDRIKAEILLEQLLEEDLSYQFQISVLLNLSELLLIELHDSNDETILEKVKKHVKSLYDFAVSNNSQLLKVHTLLLQAQIAMIELAIEKAQSLLAKIQKIVEEKGLKKLESKLIYESKRLKELTSELIEAGKKAYPISKRMELVNIQKGIREIKIKRHVEDALEDISATKKLFSISI
jgi:tetratricopeptide (TPR) repeat protein